MGAWVLLQVRGDEVDKSGEALLFFYAVVRPKIFEGPHASDQVVQAEQVFQAAFLKRVALHVEVQIARIRGREAVKAGGFLQVARQ